MFALYEAEINSFREKSFRRAFFFLSSRLEVIWGGLSKIVFLLAVETLKVLKKKLTGRCVGKALVH